MENQRIILSAVGILLLLPLCVNGKITGSYLNECSAPVLITVPYYFKGVPVPKTIDIVLQPGDLYKSKTVGNGYVYEKYGLMPGLAKEMMKEKDNDLPCLYKSQKKTLDQDYADFCEALNTSNMPARWISKEIENLDLYKKSYEGLIYNLNTTREDLKKKESSSENNFLKEREKYFKENVDRFSLLKEISDEDAKKISEPLIDIDGDGLNNYEELKCDSSPFLKDVLILYPHFMKLDPSGCQTVTGVFYLRNLSEKNIKFRLKFSSVFDARYQPRVVCAENKDFEIDETGNIMSVDIGGKQQYKFYYFLNAGFLPYEFSCQYTIACLCDEYFRVGTVIPYVEKDYSVASEKPVGLKPEPGHRFTYDSKMKFMWDLPDKKSFDDMSVFFLAQMFHVESKRTPQDLGFTVSDNESNKDCFYVEREFMNDLLPGNYIWRVVQQSFYTKPAASEWNWFSVGKEIQPPKEEKSEFKNDHIWIFRNQKKLSFYELEAGKPFKQFVCSTGDALRCTFEKPLPKGLKLSLVNKGRNWEISGTPQEVGRTTNIWMAGKEYNFTNICVFSVYSPSAGKKPRSIYHVDKKAVIHDLTLNVPFEYYAKDYYDAFSKKDGPKISSAANVRFEELPEGIVGEIQKNNYKISGIPKKKGKIKTKFVVEKGKEKREETHIFSVNDPGGPSPTVFPRGISDRDNTTQDDWLKITHRTHINSLISYDMRRDYLAINMPEYNMGLKRIEKQLSVECLEPLPEGFSLIYDNEIGSHFIEGRSKQLGNFTNHVRIVNTEITYTNTHIFIVKP